MKIPHLMLATWSLITILCLGCSQPTTTPAPTTKDAQLQEVKKPEELAHDEHHHHGAGPNGGVIFDLGKDHAEFTVDHPAKTCTVTFIDGDNEKAKPLAVAAKELTLTTKESKTADGKLVPVMTIILQPQNVTDGKASTFTGTDPALELVADHTGTVIGEVDGKPAQGEFKEE